MNRCLRIGIAALAIAALAKFASDALHAWVQDRAALLVAGRAQQTLVQSRKLAEAALKQQAASAEEIAYARDELDEKLEDCAALVGDDRIDCYLRLLREDAAARGGRAPRPAHGALR